jgi:glutamine---fructose-6-phosphate transaminase (isomerizing)
MCGIIAIAGHDNVVPRLVEALQRLEYRGYDSAGVATLNQGAIDRRRAEGKIRNLENVLDTSPLPGLIGIGHTRWATHGPPEERNAHPHVAGNVAIVHNGIIENFRELGDALKTKGRVLMSDTDTEIIAHLIDEELIAGLAPTAAVQATLKKLRGAFAIAVIFSGEENLLVGARRGSPLAAALNNGEAFLGSDALALAGLASRIVYLDEGDTAVLTRSSLDVFDAEDRPVKRVETYIPAGAAAADKGNYRHFMQKEIHEQSDAAARTFGAYLNPLTSTAKLPGGDKIDFANLDQIVIVACGTAHYAGRVAEYWLEQIAGLPVEIDIASEFRYRTPALAERSAALFVSQSGETADTLAALRLCKELNIPTIGVVNVATSSIAREADVVFPTLAGPEIGVASTKAFTAQLAALASATIAMARMRGKIDAAEEARLVAALLEVPRLISESLKMEDAIIAVADRIAKARDVLYIGRGSAFPLALEGALKLKEISYIHAEGYAAGELKHGPIALVDEHTPTIALAPHDNLMEKTISNIQEIAARRGPVYVFSDAAGIAAVGPVASGSVLVPSCDPFVAPLVYATPAHLLAYHVAVLKGTDVDQPRNLAKSVTVE